MALGLVQLPGGGSFQWFGSQIIQGVNDTIIRKQHEAGAAVVAVAKQLVHVKTGETRDSISYQVIGKTLTIIVAKKSGMFLEFGTRRNRPYPYIRPALNQISRVFGGSIEMDFAVPFINQPIFTHQAGFVLPPNLTAKQRAHVAQHLGPTSKRLYRGNVKRARLRTHRHAG